MHGSKFGWIDSVCTYCHCKDFYFFILSLFCCHFPTGDLEGCGHSVEQTWIPYMWFWRKPAVIYGWNNHDIWRKLTDRTSNKKKSEKLTCLFWLCNLLKTIEIFILGIQWLVSIHNYNRSNCLLSYNHVMKLKSKFWKYELALSETSQRVRSSPNFKEGAMRTLDRGSGWWFIG